MERFTTEQIEELEYYMGVARDEVFLYDQGAEDSPDAEGRQHWFSVSVAYERLLNQLDLTPYQRDLLREELEWHSDVFPHLRGVLKAI